MLDGQLSDFSPSFDQGTENVLLNLVAARTDRRSQGRFDRAGRNTVLAVQDLNHLWRDARQGSTPAGMNDRHDLLLGGNKEDRHAISGEDSQKSFCLSRLHAIAFAGFLDISVLDVDNLIA